jgi:hypothetical protein
MIVIVGSLALAFAGHATQPEPPKKDKIIAGKAEVLKLVPKKFGTFVGLDAAGKITLQLDGDKEQTTWLAKADAEFKVAGWWGRAEQFHKGDKVWVWFAIDRNKKPKTILMLADELSEKDIHGKLTAKELEPQREKQKEYLADIWRQQGLPGMVGFLHPLGGEMEVMLDHEGQRWGRYLKTGDKVTLKPAKNAGDFEPIQAVVKKVQPWREYTRLLLVSANSFDQMDLTVGQRLGVVVPEPPPEVQKSPFPTDMDRPRTKEERIEWFLATVYCTCKVPGDQCTGMFYTQASCNVNACGMPNNIKNQVTKMIDKGLTDQQILEELLKTRGPELLKPHLLK